MHLPSTFRRKPQVFAPPTLRPIGPPSITELAEAREQLTFVELEDPYGLRRTCLEITDTPGLLTQHLVKQLIEQSKEPRDRCTPALLRHPNVRQLQPDDITWSLAALTEGASNRPGVMIHRSITADIDENSQLVLQYSYLDGAAFCPRPRLLMNQWPMTVVHL